jgi:hypothetical protein
MIAATQPSTKIPKKPSDIDADGSISGAAMGVNSTAEIGLSVFFSGGMAFYYWVMAKIYHSGMHLIP